MGACFHDAGPGSNAKTSVRRNAVKPTGRLRRASADVARETFRSTCSPTCAEKSTGTNKSSPQRSGRKTQEAITCRSWIHQDRRLGIVTDQASFKDGGSRVDNQCELPTILSLQALDGLSAPESRIQAVPETAEAGAPMNRDLRKCCDPYLNHAEKRSNVQTLLYARQAVTSRRPATLSPPRTRTG